MSCDTVTIDDVGIYCETLGRIAGRMEALAHDLEKGDDIEVDTVVSDLKAFAFGVQGNMENIRERIGLDL